MQLVVMAAVLALVVLALAGAGQGCSFGCRLIDIHLPVEGCGRTEYIHTTICAGQCKNKDLSYVSDVESLEQEVCTGEWVYEEKHIYGYPEGVTYPVAVECNCNACNPDDDTDCGRFNGDATSCLSF